MILTSILTIALSTSGPSCSSGVDAEKAYSRFYVLFVEETGTDASGVTHGVHRKLSKSEAAEASNCLHLAGQLGSCKAIHMLDLLYRHGVASTSLGIPQDIVKANSYAATYKSQCKRG